MSKDDYGERPSGVVSRVKPDWLPLMDDGMGLPEIKLKVCSVCGNRIYQDVYLKATLCVDCRTDLGLISLQA